MNYKPESSSAETNVPRLEQLKAKLEPSDFDTLQAHRGEVMNFLRLGRKWGFFSLAEKTSAKAGREVLEFAHMPESNLAALIKGRDPKSLGALEKMVDEKSAQDPKFLPGLLISQIDRMYRTAAAEHGTTAMTAGDSPEMLAKETDPKLYLRWVNTPAPTHAVPEWFHVMEKYGMGPADLEMIYREIDRRNEAASAQGVDTMRKNDENAIGSVTGL